MEDPSSAMPGADLHAMVPPAARHVSPDAFLQAICIAWHLLGSAERKAIRKCCRSGRLLHDSLLTDLRITLGYHAPKDACEAEPTQPAAGPSPTPAQLRGSLQGLVSRGARLQSLTVTFWSSRDESREAQLLAALAACSGCPLTRLELHGAVPLSEEVAEAVHACFPQLSILCLDHRNPGPSLHRMMKQGPQWEPSEAYHLGCVRLLALCGPRLTDLQLWGLHCWRTPSYMALRHCTALDRLELEACQKDPYPEPCISGHFDEGPTTVADVFAAVAQLATLRRLHLTLRPKCYASPDALAPHAACVAHLGALTALTHLHLGLPHCFEHLGDSRESWARWARPMAWCRAQEAHRTSLLSALRAMPQLQHLHCRTLWLRVSELAALTALTSVTLAGLLPHPWHCPPALGLRDGLSSLPGGSEGALPCLRKLQLCNGASPRALAQLQPLTACLARMGEVTMRFGMGDVDEEGQLTAEAVAAVGPAVQLLAACGGYKICIFGDGGPCRLLSRAGSPNGHMEWIRQLQGLDARWTAVELERVELSTGDLCCLGRTLPNLWSLDLRDCCFPLAAVSGLRPSMRRLSSVFLDLCCIERVDSWELDAVLLLLCRPHEGVPPVTTVECVNCPTSLGLEECVDSIAGQMETDFGVEDMDVCLSRV